MDEQQPWDRLTPVSSVPHCALLVLVLQVSFTVPLFGLVAFGQQRIALFTEGRNRPVQSTIDS
jgi:hypothetical protein